MNMDQQLTELKDAQSRLISSDGIVSDIDQYNELETCIAELEKRSPNIAVAQEPPTVAEIHKLDDTSEE